MKMVATILLKLSLCACALAQTPFGTQQAPDIKVLNYRWGVVHSTTFKQNPGYGADASTPQDDRNRKEGVSKMEEIAINRQYSPDTPRINSDRYRQRKVEQRVDRVDSYAYVRNTGDKTIKAVSWRYVFYADSNYEKEVKHFSFRNKTDLTPGGQRNLVKQVVEPAATPYQNVVIDIIEYADGSKWQRSDLK